MELINNIIYFLVKVLKIIILLHLRDKLEYRTLNPTQKFFFVCNVHLLLANEIIPALLINFTILNNMFRLMNW
jgi:hypothetical protein